MLIRTDKNIEYIGGLIEMRPPLAIGTTISTKGEVGCWEGKPGRREFGYINGLGEVLSGPDPLDRYEVLIKGCRVWLQRQSFVAKGRS